MISTITPCLWFDDQAEEAAQFYIGIFPDSKITEISRYPQEHYGKPVGATMVVAFELNGRPFTGLNGGPHFQFTEALSLQVACDDQKEIDYYWKKLSEGSDPDAGQCGWIKDKFGLFWQIFPKALTGMLQDPDRAKALRAFQSMCQMKKIDLAELERAFAG